MKIYYERMIYCDCGFSIRQTAENLPLDNVGLEMAYRLEKSFRVYPVLFDKRRTHKCSLKLRYSEWIIKC